MLIRRPTPRPAPVPRRTEEPRQPITPRRTVARFDELSTGRGAALRANVAKYLQAAPAPTKPQLPTSHAVQPGDSYWSVAQRHATAFLAQQNVSPADPSYQTAWNRLSYRMVQDLMASNGSRPLRPGDVLALPDPAQYGLVPGAKPAPVQPAPVQPAPVQPTPVQPAPGPVTPSEPGVPTDVGGAMVNQFAGDPDGRNGNCGFASSLMTLKLLGIDSPALSSLSSDYAKAMKLRELGGGGTNDRAWGTVAQVVKGLNAAGAHAAAVPNTWGSDKAQAVELMKQAFLSGTPTAFVVAGNPALGWPQYVSYNGGHFVTVAGYDAASNTFTVLDPVAKQPIQVTPEQLAGYLKDTNAEAGEVVQVTR